MFKALKLIGGNRSPFGFSREILPFEQTNTFMNFQNLKYQTIKNQTVILSNYGDIHYFRHAPKFLCTTLILNRCDKNFVATWFSRQTFPNVTTTFIGSHPYDSYILRQDVGILYLHEDYCRYKDMWASNIDRVQLITDQDYEFNLRKYENEPIDLLIT